MPTLSVIDLAMFLLETAERPFNVGPLVILTPPQNFRGNFADRLTERMLRRPIGAPFNYRLEMLRAGAPHLKVDPTASAADHVQRLTLKGPATMVELCATVCAIHQQRLDRTRPLWELYVIDGLADGKVAIYAKVHHGIIDGRTFVSVVGNWLAKSPREREVRALWEGVERAPRASGARATLMQRAGRAFNGATGTIKSAVGLSRLLARQTLTTVGLGRGMALPILNVPHAYKGPLSADRSFAHGTLPLAEVKAVAKAHDATVNDVLLATLDIAMSRDLRARKQLPRRPLVADMPLALQDARGGNQIAVMQFPLGRPGAAPIERIAAIRREASHVKETIRQATAETVMLYTTLVHGFPALLERLGAKSLAISNVLISNPFGLTEDRYLMGARVELVLPISVVAAGQMLNVTAVTLGERLQIGLLAMPHAVPDVGALASYMVDAFAELKRAAGGPVRAMTKRTARPAARRATKSSTKTKTRPEPIHAIARHGRAETHRTSKTVRP